MLLVLAFAFVAGLLTILAPCTLPIVPLVLGAGTLGGRRRALGVALGFGGTFVVLSVVLASAFAAAGFSTSLLRGASALALGFFGACLAFPAIGDRLASRLSRLGAFGSPPVAAESTGLAGGMVIGAAVGLVWAPCVGPLMASVLAVASTSGPTLQTVAIASAYVAGASLPLFAIATLGRRAVRAAGSPRRRARFQRVFGALMIVVSLAVVAQYDVRLEDAVATVLPDGWTATLNAVATGPSEQEVPGPETFVDANNADFGSMMPLSSCRERASEQINRCNSWFE